MENKRRVGGSSLDHLFGPKDSPSSSSSSTGIFGSIFSTPSTAPGRDPGSQGGNGNYGKSDSNSSIGRGEGSGVTGKDKMTSVYQNESVQPCYFSSSIYYGGQENYSPKTKNSESHNMFKKMVEMMIPMATIQIVLQEGTGGKVHFTIDPPTQVILKFSSYNLRPDDYEQLSHEGNKT